jgi:hypothetical protein
VLFAHDPIISHGVAARLQFHSPSRPLAEWLPRSSRTFPSAQCQNPATAHRDACLRGRSDSGRPHVRAWWSCAWTHGLQAGRDGVSRERTASSDQVCIGGVGREIEPFGAGNSVRSHE